MISKINEERVKFNRFLKTNCTDEITQTDDILIVNVSDSDTACDNDERSSNVNYNAGQPTNSTPPVNTTPLSAENPPQQPSAPKWKWFHISSIVPLTSDIIRNYISIKFGGVTVRCFSLTPRNSKTFKVGVPIGYAKQLFSSSFWPLGTYVRDFHTRKNFRQRRNTTPLG